MAKRSQSHGLQVNIGSLKPQSGQARVIATGAPSSGNVDRTNVNHNPKPGSAAHGPAQLANQGPQSNATGPNVKPVNGTRTPRGRRPS